MEHPAHSTASRRSYCPTPDNCAAPKRGACMCQVDALAKMREAQRGRKHSPETIAKMREAQLGRKRSPETIAKMREAQLGRKRSPETIAKMREGYKKRQNYIPIPDHLKSYAKKLRSCGIRGDELRKAIEVII